MSPYGSSKAAINLLTKAWGLNTARVVYASMLYAPDLRARKARKQWAKLLIH